MRRPERTTRRALWALALSSAGSACTPRYVRNAQRCIQSTRLDRECEDSSFARWAADDPARATQAYRAFLERSLRACARVEARSTDLDAKFMCLRVVRYVLGDRPSARVDPFQAPQRDPLDSVVAQSVAVDWARGVSLLELMCDPADDDYRRPNRAAFCGPYAELLAATTPEDGRNLEWITVPIRVQGTRAMLAQFERERAALGPAEQLQRLEGMSRFATHRHDPQHQLDALRAEIDARRDALASVDLDHQVALLENRPVTPDTLETLLGELGRLTASPTFRTASEAATARARIRLGALVGRSIDSLVLDSLRRGRAAAAEPILSRAEAAGHHAPVANARAALRRGAAEFHTGRAREHLAAGRYAAARLHAGLARANGATLRFADADRYIAALLRPRLEVTLSGPACAWIRLPTRIQGATEAAPGDGGAWASGRVEWRWTRCESGERRWDSRERYTYTTTETREVIDRETLPATTSCHQEYRTVVHQTWGRGGGISAVPELQEVCATVPERTVERRRMVTTDAPHSAERDVTNRALETRAEAALVVTRGGQRVRIASFGPSAALLSEVQYDDAHGSSRFSATTPQTQRESLASEMVSLLLDGGGLQRRLADAEAARQLELGTSLRERDPEGAEEAFARALTLTNQPDAAAGEFFRARYGVEPGAARNASQ